MRPRILVVEAGLVPYGAGLEAQNRLVAARQAGEIPDVLLLLEHPSVYTRGRRADPAELPLGTDWYRERGIEIVDTDRGGRVTYHGPGQLVAYPIVDLAAYGDDVHAYVRRLERVMIEALAAAGIAAGPIAGQTGVWVGSPGPGENPGPAAGPSTSGAAKIGSIGVHVSRGVTSHGLAVNVDNDLTPFEWIVPCGIEGCAVTSVAREAPLGGGDRDVAGFAADLTARFADVFERDPVTTEPGELGLEIETARLGVQ